MAKKKDKGLITAEMLRKWGAEGSELIREQERESQLPQGRNDFWCAVCKTTTVKERIFRQFDPSSGPMIIGPGSRHQYRTVHDGGTCANCGLHYDELRERP